MKYSAATVLAGLSTLAFAQLDLASIPRCAQACLAGGLTVPGCQPGDIACVCGNDEFLNGISCCLSSTCNPEEQQAAVSLAQGICGPVGVQVPDTVVCRSGSGESTESTTEEAMMESSTMAATSTEETTAAGAAATESAASAVSSAESMASSAVSSVESMASSAISSAGAEASSAVSSLASRASSAGAAVTSAARSGAASATNSVAAVTTNGAMQMGSGLGLAGAAAAIVAML